MLNSAVAAYHYLRIIVMMDMHGPSDTAPELPARGAGLRLGMFAAVALIR